MCGSHMSPVFTPYKHTTMQNKNTFMNQREIRILMMVFLYFSAATVNITYGGFTFHNYYLHGAWIFFILCKNMKFKMHMKTLIK
jgi:hypothetical protein